MTLTSRATERGRRACLKVEGEAAERAAGRVVLGLRARAVDARGAVRGRLPQRVRGAVDRQHLERHLAEAARRAERGAARGHDVLEPAR